MTATRILSAVATPDWLTAVATGHLDRCVLRSLATRYLSLALRTHRWGLQGYVGRSSADIPTLDGGLAYGENLALEKSILQSWGSLTQKVLTELMALHEMRWTRCDLALTVLYDNELPHVSLWDRTTDDSAVNLSMITGNGEGGGTMYVGKRGSEQFGRIYDKGDQLHTVPPRRYWRWEVEYKRGSALNVVSSLLSFQHPEQRSVWIAEQVEGWFRERGLQCPQMTSDRLGYPMVRYGTRVTCDQTTIKWLSQQVNPALRRLEKNGVLGKAFAALGVDGSCQMSDDEVADVMDSRQQDFLDKMQNP